MACANPVRENRIVLLVRVGTTERSACSSEGRRIVRFSLKPVAHIDELRDELCEFAAHTILETNNANFEPPRGKYDTHRNRQEANTAPTWHLVEDRTNTEKPTRHPHELVIFENFTVI